MVDRVLFTFSMSLLIFLPRRSISCWEIFKPNMIMNLFLPLNLSVFASSLEASLLVSYIFMIFMSSFCIDHFIFMKRPSLTLAMLFVLKFALSDIYRASLTFLMIVVCLTYLFQFFYCQSIWDFICKCNSQRQHIIGSCFFW